MSELLILSLRLSPRTRKNSFRPLVSLTLSFRSLPRAHDHSCGSEHRQTSKSKASPCVFLRCNSLVQRLHYHRRSTKTLVHVLLYRPITCEQDPKSSFQCILKVIDQRGKQNHNICRKQKCKPKAPEQDSLLALAAPQDPVHENQIQDHIERAALAEPNTQGENAWLYTENANTAFTVFISIEWPATPGQEPSIASASPTKLSSGPGPKLLQVQKAQVDFQGSVLFVQSSTWTFVPPAPRKRHTLSWWWQLLRPWFCGFHSILFLTSVLRIPSCMKSPPAWSHLP